MTEIKDNNFLERREILDKLALKAYELFKKKDLTFKEFRYVIARVREVAAANAKI